MQLWPVWEIYSAVGAGAPTTARRKTGRPKRLSRRRPSPRNRTPVLPHRTPVCRLPICFPQRNPRPAPPPATANPSPRNRCGPRCCRHPNAPPLRQRPTRPHPRRPNRRRNCRLPVCSPRRSRRTTPTPPPLSNLLPRSRCRPRCCRYPHARPARQPPARPQPRRRNPCRICRPPVCFRHRNRWTTLPPPAPANPLRQNRCRPRCRRHLNGPLARQLPHRPLLTGSLRRNRRPIPLPALRNRR